MIVGQPLRLPGGQNWQAERLLYNAEAKESLRLY